MNKLLEKNQLSRVKKKFPNKKIVLCHGVFDVLHIGHLKYLKLAKKLGNILVVSVTHDNFVNKGPGRPAFNVQNRLSFLNEISFIDYICISNSETSAEIIKNLKPNYYCKGIDYIHSTKKNDRKLDIELKSLKSVRGKFSIIKEENFSSSKLINDNNFQNLSEECRKFVSTIRSKFDLNEIAKKINILKDKKVLVIGETIIDKYTTTEAIGKSGKEPIMVVKKKKDIIFLGGVGYVANLCSSFSKKTKLISFLGDLRTQKKFVLQNLKKKIDHHFLIKKNSPTIVKTRYLDEYKKNKIIGIYDINDDIISKSEEIKFYNILKKEIKNFDIIVVTDYGHGIFTKKIRNLIQKNNQKVFLNTQINSFNRGYHSINKYKKANTLIINESELRYELRDRNSNLINLVKKIRKKIKTNYIIVTRGNLGSLIVNCKKWTTVTCPAFNVRSIDSVGAGDTFLALSALTLGSKLEDDLSMFISSLGASFSTNQVGNISIFNNEILKKQLSHILK